jgi:glutamine cyclotransferase
MMNRILLSLVLVTCAYFYGCEDKRLEEPRLARPQRPMHKQVLRPISKRLIPTHTYEIINVFPHDPYAFTQGLAYEDGFLFEGTGRYQQSTLRKIELESGKIILSIKLENQFFGEGIALLFDKIYQLTWRSNIGFVYDKHRFFLRQRFEYPTEGWGMTSDGTHLIMSDGSSKVYFYDPETFTEIKRIEVYDHFGPIQGLNELEYINGLLYANIYPTANIIAFSLETGEIMSCISLKGLINSADHKQPLGVLNGIAWDKDNDRIFVTGKLWPSIFEIKIVPAKSPGKK